MVPSLQAVDRGYSRSAREAFRRYGQDSRSMATLISESIWAFSARTSWCGCFVATLSSVPPI